MTKIVYARTKFEGLHYWQGAPEGSFLRHPHRHVFHVAVSVTVSHMDRAVEFFVLKNHVDEVIDTWLKTWPVSHPPVSLHVFTASCEMIAEVIFNALRNDFAVFQVNVSEDGENGAIVGA